MLMTFPELERRAYINGRTYLAKAYAAADDANIAANEMNAQDSVANTMDKVLTEAHAALEAAAKEADEKRAEATESLQIGLDI